MGVVCEMFGVLGVGCEGTKVVRANATPKAILGARKRADPTPSAGAVVVDSSTNKAEGVGRGRGVTG